MKVAETAALPKPAPPIVLKPGTMITREWRGTVRRAHEGWRLVLRHYDDGGFSGGSLDRPGLKALLADIDKGLVDIVVVYKVDRLTRSLTDFAWIVEVLDRKGASFVSVTQQFNTISSMGRLTLNVFLSFAQFEREVTGELIRDKVAASKKKGLWIGGYPPLGYDILNRKLAINEGEATTVRSIYERFLALESVRALSTELRQKGVVSKRWKTRHGTMRGDNALSRGALYHLLRNPIYLGEVRHKDKTSAGEHRAILPRELWEQVQARLYGLRGAHTRGSRPRGSPAPSGLLLTGLLYDDRGNRMSPSHVKKMNGVRYRYYLNQALLQHRKAEAGLLARIATAAIEGLVIDRVTRCAKSAAEGDADPATPSDIREKIRAIVQRVELGRDRVRMTLSKSALAIGAEVLRQRLPSTDKIGETNTAFDIAIPIRLRTWGGETAIEGPNGARAVAATHIDKSLLNALVRAFEWRNMLAFAKVTTLAEIAAAYSCNESHIRHRLPLAFLAPGIVSEILDGQQARHVTLDRLIATELPLSWERQRKVLGLLSR
jgi:DNA invertase Pin-like site-specific DNA recombinase